MKPIDLGYQPGRGIGSAKFQTEQNVSLEPETQAIRKSALPNALGYVTQQTPYITESLKLQNQAQQAAVPQNQSFQQFSNNIADRAKNTFNQSVTNVGSSIYNTTGSATTNAWQGVPYPLPQQTQSYLYNGWGNALGGAGSSTLSNTGSFSAGIKNIASGAKSAMKAAVQDVSGQLAKESAKRAGTSTLGTAMSAVGTALGAYTMANQIADFGSHRSASDMMANVGRAQNTTEYGNQYTTYNGVNAGQELAYEKANARSKQLGFGMNAIGTGASIGSFFGPLGTGIGAIGGLLLGGLGSLFGWGDNSEEIERITRLTNDNIAMYNREQESVARSKDVAAEFNDRQSVGSAAGGKNAYGPMDAKKGDDINTPKMLFDVNAENNISVGIPTSKLMPGETVFNKENIENWGRVPGKGNKDNVYSAVRPGDSTVVLTNKGGISKLGAAVLKSNAPENLKLWQLNELEKKQAALQESENNQNNMRNYKCGKLPGYWKGTDYLMSAIPHLAALGSSWNQYNRAKYADMPDYPTIVDSDANTEALNILGRRRFNPEPILNMLNDQHRHALYELHRTPGLTAGGQAIAMANQNIKTSRAKAEALAQADEINNRYTADYANAMSNYGKWLSEMMTNNNYARAAFKQQQNAAKEGWMAQYQKNGLTALADLASDVMGVRQFNRSEDYQDKMLKLYGQQVDNDADNAKAQLELAEQARLDREAAYRETLKQAAEKTHPMFANYGSFRPDGIWNAFGDPVFNLKLNHPQFDQKYAKYFKPVGFKDGKGGFVSRGNNLGSYVEEIQPGNILGIGDSDGYSIKMITADGDTVYQKPGVFSKDVVRKKGGPASKEYIKAKQKHERLLKNATPSYNIGMDQLLRMFGF